jgi:hypothetical protein
MTADETKQFEKLREQLDSADQVRHTLSDSMCRLTCELKLYRGLFWCLLAVLAVNTILRLLQH